MKTLSASDIVQVPLDQHLQLVEDLRDSIAEFPASVEVQQWHRKVLECRLKACSENPQAISHWAEVKREILRWE
jgi:putative addiction module component (TIGR02574 family)